jgi:hypothetical protein
MPETVRSSRLRVQRTTPSLRMPSCHRTLQTPRYKQRTRTVMTFTTMGTTTTTAFREKKVATTRSVPEVIMTSMAETTVTWNKVTDITSRKITVTSTSSMTMTMEERKAALNQSPNPSPNPRLSHHSNQVPRPQPARSQLDRQGVPNHLAALLENLPIVHLVLE